MPAADDNPETGEPVGRAGTENRYDGTVAHSVATRLETVRSPTRSWQVLATVDSDIAQQPTGLPLRPHRQQLGVRCSLGRDDGSGDGTGPPVKGNLRCRCGLRGPDPGLDRCAIMAFGPVTDQASAGDLPDKDYGRGNGLFRRVESRRRPRVAGGIYQSETVSAFRGGENFELTCHGALLHLSPRWE